MDSKHTLWITLAAFLLLIFVMKYVILQNTNGVFAYPLDDAKPTCFVVQLCQPLNAGIWRYC